MAGSTLDPDNLPPSKKRKTQPGKDTKALGPSNSSDSGSDVQDAGPDVGNLDMDADTDAAGTGEHLTVGKEPRIRPGGDQDTDRVENDEESEQRGERERPA